MTKSLSRQSRGNANRRPIFAWIAHHLRLAGRVSASQAARVFGVNTRQFRRWMEDYNAQSHTHGDPEGRLGGSPWGAGTADPVYIAQGLTPEQIERSDNRARGQGHVFPIASGLLPTTSEALDLLDAWRAHSILARTAPSAFGDPGFLDDEGNPLVVEVGEAIHPRLDGDVIPTLLQAITLRRAVSMDYINKQGVREYRTFSPHRFIHSQGRYHVRGYDELRHRCLDMNPARAFSTRLLPEDAPYWGPETDKEWTRQITLSFGVIRAVRENEEHWSSIRQTFPVKDDGTLEVQTRQALSYYVRLHIERYALRDQNGNLVRVFFGIS